MMATPGSQSARFPGSAPLLYTVESDAEGGLLVIRYRGRVAAEDVAGCAEEVADALRANALRISAPG